MSVRYQPPRNTKKAIYWYIPSTPIPLPKGAAVRKLTAAQKKAAAKPAGPRGSSTYIYNPTFPDRSISAEDVAVQFSVPLPTGSNVIGRIGFNGGNPTEGGGVVTAAAIAALIADSGPLPAGTYFVEVDFGGAGVNAAGKYLAIEHRNAANAATLIVRGICPYSQRGQVVCRRIVVALNERIRVVQGPVAGAAAEVGQAVVRCYLLPI